MSVSLFQGYSPGRPPQIRDVELALNGDPTFLGVIVSSGAAVDNSTTAIPFNQTASGAGLLTGTLAGKALLIQPTVAGFVLASAVPMLGNPAGLITVTTFASTGPFATTAPGLKIQTEERTPFFMSSAKGWLQFIPNTGSANLFVWELI